MRVAVASVALVAALAGCTPAQAAPQPRDVLAHAGTVSVLGDSTGNDPGEWVDLWAKHLGNTRRVTLHQWDKTRQDWDPTPVTYGTSGAPLTIWNGSQPGARATYPLDKLSRIQPVRPDLVVYSFGHNDVSWTIVSELSKTMHAVNARWGSVPDAVILQNPGQGAHGTVQDATLATLKTWAASTHTPTVDVTSAFRAAPNFPALMKDQAHPNWHGEILWESVVARTIG